MSIANNIPSRKRKLGEDGEEEVSGNSGSRLRQNIAPEKGLREDYVNFVGDMMYPKRLFGPHGYNAEKGRFPVDRITSLGFLLSPLRRPTVMEKWSPFEVSLFEASLMLYGKNFNQVQKHVKTKTVKEVIEFYYDWKKTSHYKHWKKNYLPDERELPNSQDE